MAERVFTLHASKLNYSTSEGEVKGSFPINRESKVRPLTCEEAPENRESCFCIITGSQQLFLTASSELNRNAWIRCIHTAITGVDVDLQREDQRRWDRAEGRMSALESALANMQTVLSNVEQQFREYKVSAIEKIENLSETVSTQDDKIQSLEYRIRGHDEKGSRIVDVQSGTCELNFSNAAIEDGSINLTEFIIFTRPFASIPVVSVAVSSLQTRTSDVPPSFIVRALGITTTGFSCVLEASESVSGITVAWHAHSNP